MLKYWLFLLLSIVFEVAGTTIMKLSQLHYPVTGMIIMYILIGLSYFSLSKAVLRLPIGVAYAFWEGLGLILITAVSFIFLGEHFGPLRGIAVCMLLVGTYIVHAGTESHGESK